MHSDSTEDIRKRAQAAEQRGLAFFHKLGQMTSTTSPTTVDEEEESSSLAINTPTSAPPARQSAHSQSRFSKPRHMTSPASSGRSTRLSTQRKSNYPSASTPHTGRAMNDITVTFSFFIPDTKLSPLPMTLHPGLSVRQVKVMLCKKISTTKVVLPSDLVISVDGRELRDASALSEVPVQGGSFLRVSLQCTDEEGDENKEDSFLAAQTGTSIYQTPLSKGNRKFTAPPSTIQHSPVSFLSSSPHPNDITGLSSFHSLHPTEQPHGGQSSVVHRLTSTEKTPTGGSIISEEAAFYEILEEVLVSIGGRKCPADLDSVEHQSQLAEAYSREVADRYESTVGQLSLHSSPRFHQQLLRDLEDMRAERDLWSLVSRLLVQGLLKDIQDGPNEKALSDFLASVSPCESLKEVITRSIEADERIKKGRVLKDWIENCSRDHIHEPPEPAEDDKSYFPWNETLNRLKRKRNGSQNNTKKLSPTGVAHLHPDSQIGPQGLIIPLDGDDHTDQETLLKVIWQHIRGGQLVQAQALAHRHKVHWLAAALLGVAEEFYTFDCENADGEGISRRGNKNRPQWMEICWKYALSIDGNPANKISAPGGKLATANEVAVLETAIFAALSTNYALLKESVLLHTSADHLWARIKCAHERQIVYISNQFRKKRRQLSNLYPGSTDKVVAAEDKYLKNTIQLQSALCGNSADLLRDIISHNQGSHSNISGLILQLQVALIQGKTALRAFIQNDIRAFALQARAKTGILLRSEGDKISEHCRLLRIFVHFLIWLLYSCEAHADLRALVTHDVLYVVLEAYIACLAYRQQYSLVALYCSYLSRPKRVASYMALLRIISPTSVRSDEGHIVPASVLFGQSSSLANSLSFSGHENMTGHFGAPSLTCMALSGRNTGLRGVDDDATAHEILTLAKKFFPEEDIVEITNAVVDQARKGEDGASQLSVSLGDSVRVFSSFKGIEGGKAMGNSSSNTLQGSQAALTYASQTASTTVVPGVYNEGTIPVDDAERMESLRWLCYYEEHCADAAKRANAFLRSFVIESSGSKTLQVRVLITNILPSNFIIAGTEYLQMKLQGEENEVVKKMLEDSWDADVGQLQLWKYVDWSVHCHEQFEKEMQNFLAKREEFVGDANAIVASLSSLKHQILRCATRCIKSVRKALGCGERGVPADFQGHQYFDDSKIADDEHAFDGRGGFLAIWSNSIDTTIAELLELLVVFASEVESNKQVLDREVVEDKSIVVQLMEDCTTALNQLEEHPISPELGVGSASASLFSPPVGLDMVREHLKVVEVQAKAAVTANFSTTSILEKVRDMLQSIIDNRMAMQIVANILCKHYLEVSMQTASMLEILQSPTSEVLQWYQEASDLAVLLADEAENMQLYKALRMGDLDLILSSVGVANVHILRMQKSFDIHASDMSYA